MAKELSKIANRLVWIGGLFWVLVVIRIAERSLGFGSDDFLTLILAIFGSAAFFAGMTLEAIIASSEEVISVIRQQAESPSQHSNGDG